MSACEVKSIALYRSYFEAGQLLCEDQRHRLYDAITEFAFCGVEPDFEGGISLQLAWSLCRPNVEKSIENALNGSKGGRPRKQETTIVNAPLNPGY